MNENQPLKIAVLGAGAVGSLFGALLARAGEDVTLIARRAHADAIRENGLYIDGVTGPLHVRVKVAEHLDFRPDLVLLAVKTQDVLETCLSVRDIAGEATILTLQNGMRSDELVASVFLQDQVVSGVVMLNVQYLAPGRINYARSGALLIGEPFGPNGERVAALKRLLQKAVPTEISQDIRGAHWAKLLINNLGNSLEAMTGMPISECMQYTLIKKIGILTLREGYRLIRKAGFRLAALPGVPLMAFLVLVYAPLPLAARLLARSFGKADTISSTLQSLRRKRPTEIDYLNGEMVALAEKIGLPCRYNARVVDLVHQVEKTGRFFEPVELARQFSLKP